jgi:hypothetical protein
VWFAQETQRSFESYAFLNAEKEPPMFGISRTNRSTKSPSRSGRANRRPRTFEGLERRNLFAVTPLFSSTLQPGLAAVENGSLSTVVVSPAVIKNTVQRLNSINKATSEDITAVIQDGKTTAKAAANLIGLSSSKTSVFLQTTEMSRSFSMQYLMLQEKMQRENREVSMISNIMTTKHDTVKNSIPNGR